MEVKDVDWGYWRQVSKERELFLIFKGPVWSLWLVLNWKGIYVGVEVGEEMGSHWSNPIPMSYDYRGCRSHSHFLMTTPILILILLGGHTH